MRDACCVAALLPLLLSLLACWGAEEDKGFIEEYSRDYTIWRPIELYGDLRLQESSLPGATGERVVFFEELESPLDGWWVLDVDVTGEDAREFTLSIDYADFGGCYFEGSGSAFQGELTRGSCVIPRPAGHVYFMQTEGASYNMPTPDYYGTQTTIFRGIWLEERHGFYLTGEGSLYLRQNLSSENFKAKPLKPAAYRDALSGHTGGCQLVDLRGDGEVLEGVVPGVCEGAKRWEGGPFTVYLDETGRMSYVPLTENAAEDRIPGVPSASGKQHTVFSGVESGPHERYTFDHEARTFRFERAFFHQHEQQSSFCRIAWTGPMTACP